MLCQQIDLKLCYREHWRDCARALLCTLKLCSQKLIILLNINKMLKLICCQICLNLSLSMQNNRMTAGKAGYLGHLDISPEDWPHQVG